MKTKIKGHQAALLAGSIFISSSIASHGATIATFTGGDVGEGLALTNYNLEYAVNLGADQADVTVQGVTFTSATSAGLTVGAVNLASNWGAVKNYGSSSNDDNLEGIMRNALLDWFGANPDSRTVAFNTGNTLTIGETYRLQMFFHEPSDGVANRFFDISVEGSLIVDDFNSTQGDGLSAAQGYVVTYDFVAGDEALDILLTAGSTGNPDPFIQAFTLHVVPEPSSTALLGLGLSSLLLRRKRS